MAAKHRKTKRRLSLLLPLALLCACHEARQASSQNAEQRTQKGGVAMKITSAAFQDGGLIPRKYTCDGEDLSPPLAWADLPRETQSIALIADDPDAPRGTWVHWVIYDLPPEARELSEGVPPADTLPNGAKQGRNDFGKIGYGGPCPPRGTHRYFFKLYALDRKLGLPAGKTKQELLDAMRGYVLAEAQLMGRYGR